MATAETLSCRRSKYSHLSPLAVAASARVGSSSPEFVRLRRRALAGPEAVLSVEPRCLLPSPVFFPGDPRLFHVLQGVFSIWFIHVACASINLLI
ncbi:hypothetical protein MUK42_17533 [Musa troglodytarum]|uniref:Uncharacterized protein n=1 Tax=Musa troglodytarum TaxID=320322 RepID=A0A9E7KP98_9LILI|nr:hypothetical protein MUK42_17533 [Musa troglodytarum]